MADELDKLLDERAADDGSDVDALLDNRASAPDPADTAVPSISPEERAKQLQSVKDHFAADDNLPWYERAARGFVDPAMGAGQMIQNVVPDSLLNAGRKVTDPLLNAVLPGEDQDTSKTSTADYNSMIRREEGAYQGKRQDAGQEGADWWRIGGTVANPVTWLSPIKGGPGVMAGLKAGAATGAFQALLQPVTSQGSFLFDKTMQTALGGVFGGGLGGAFAKIAPTAAKAAEYVRSKFANGANSAATAAQQTTDDVLRAVGADPDRVDPIVRQTMAREVFEAADAGVAPDPTTMTNRADAAALPVPIDLPRWMAGRDGNSYSLAWNKARQTGGEEFKANIEDVTKGLVTNLDNLGAGRALSPFEASKQFIGRIQQFDEGLTTQIDDAYQKVRDSAGRPALMNHQQFLANAREKLKFEQVEDFLPPEIVKAVNALELGNTPLTVNTAQTLDKVWSKAQRSTNDGNAKTAIGILRESLNNTPIDDVLGAESMAAYQQARGLAKQRFDLIGSNPAYKAVVDGAKTAEPEKFFKNFIAGADASRIPGLKAILGEDLVGKVRDTAVLGLKKAAIGNSSDANAAFGQASYNNALQHEVNGPRLREWFKEDQETLGHLYRVGRTAENAFKLPAVNSANVSQSTNAAINAIKDAVGTAAASAASGPLGGVLGLIRMGSDYAKKAAQQQVIRDAASTGVTKEPARKVQSGSTRRISSLLSGLGGIAAPEDEE